MNQKDIFLKPVYKINEQELNEAYKHILDIQHKRLELSVKNSNLQLPARLEVGIATVATKFRLYVNNKQCIGTGLGNPWLGGGVFGGTLFIYTENFETLVAKTKTFYGNVEFLVSGGIAILGENSETLAYFHGGGISDIPLLNAGGAATWTEDN